MAELSSSPALSNLGQQHGKGKAKVTKGNASKSSSKQGKPKVQEAVTLEQFISQMLPLIDLEKVVIRSLRLPFITGQFCCFRVLDKIIGLTPCFVC